MHLLWLLKCDELYRIAVNNNSAVVAVSETWINADILNCNSGCTIHRWDRDGSGRGGVDQNITQIRLTHLEEVKNMKHCGSGYIPVAFLESCIIAAV